MNDTELMLLAAAAVAGALLAGAWCRWRAARQIALLEARLQMSELARHAIQERSDQARLQIGQLTKALADANRLARHPAPPPEPLPDLTPEPAPDPLLQRRGPPEAFPDTQVL